MKRYGAEEARTWDLAVTASRQGTFLLMRHYMDYHADRFTDASLLFYDGSHGRLRGVLPATVDGDTAVSHGGLTYGGLLTPAGVGTLETMEMLSAVFTVVISMWSSLISLRRRLLASEWRRPEKQQKIKTSRTGSM